MLEKRSIDLAVAEPIFLPGRTANGERLTNFLLYRSPLPPHSYPRHFNLSLYTPIMHNLYLQSQNVHVHTNAEREATAKVAEKVKWDNPSLVSLLGDEIPDIEREFFEKMNEQAPGERLTVVYRDPDTGAIDTTSVTFGEYTSVSTHELYWLKTTGKQSVIALHTHPDDSLLSPQDYFTMITSRDRVSPMIKGQLVLCPSLQIMALATDQTPLLSETDARQLVEAWNWNALVEEDDEGIALKATAKEISSRLTTYTQEEMYRGLEIAQRIMSQGRMRRSERRSAEREVEKAERKYHSTITRYERELAQAKGALNAYLNAQLIDFAHCINVVLYVSTNARDFFRFTA